MGAKDLPSEFKTLGLPGAEFKTEELSLRSRSLEILSVKFVGLVIFSNRLDI